MLVDGGKRGSRVNLVIDWCFLPLLSYQGKFLVFREYPDLFIKLHTKDSSELEFWQNIIYAINRLP